MTGGDGKGHIESCRAALARISPDSLPAGAESAIRRCTISNGLTPREAQIVCLICCGLKNDEIGRRLDLTTSTVRFHLRNVHSKTHTIDKLDLVLHVWRLMEN